MTVRVPVQSPSQATPAQQLEALFEFVGLRPASPTWAIARTFNSGQSLPKAANEEEK